MKRKHGMEHAVLLATEHQRWCGSGMVKPVVTLAGHGQLVRSMTPTETLGIRLSTVSHAGAGRVKGSSSKQEGKGLMKSCCFVQSWHCFMQSWREI